MTLRNRSAFLAAAGIAAAIALCVGEFLVYLYGDAQWQAGLFATALLVMGGLQYRTVKALRKTSKDLNFIAKKTAAMAAAEDYELRLRPCKEDEIANLARSFDLLLDNLQRAMSVNSEVLDAVPDPIFLVDDNFRILRANRAMSELTGQPLEKLVGRHCGDIMGTDACHGDECPMAMKMKGLSVPEGKLQSCVMGGEKVTLLPYVSTIRDANGQVVGHLEVARNVTKLADKQAEVEASLDRLRDIGRATSAAVAEMVGTASDLSTRISGMAEGAAVQQERTSSSATAMEMINATVQEVAQSASVAVQSAEQAREQAGEGAQVVRQSVQAIQSVSRISEELQSKMEDFQDHARNIGAIITVISEIADQTNLLALNAAIEAARAGDAGRGFAVVADEVRKLAEKTMSATGEVGSAVQSIQDAAKQNVIVMQEALDSIETATDLAERSGEALERIVDLVDSTTEQMRAIAESTEEQSASTQEVSQAIEEVSRISTQTAGVVNETSEGIEHLAEMSRSLERLTAV